MSEPDAPESAPAAPPAGNDEAPAATTAAAAPAPARGRPVVAWLALLLAVAALAGGGFLVLQWQNLQGRLDELAGLDDTLAERSTQLARLDERVATLTEADRRLEREAEELGAALTAQGRELEAVPLRLERLEQALENVPGVAGRARAAWLLAEAEYYLRVGNAQLVLARNPVVALRALELADAKLKALADPGLTAVRGRLAEEMTALRAVPQPDTEGIVLALGSLAGAMDTLPLNQDLPSRYGRDQGTEDSGAGLQRAWAAIKSAVLSIVSVRRSDAAPEPLRSPEEESLLRRGLATELELAQLAVMRGQAPIYRDALARVGEQLARHFDPDAPAVLAARGQLAELAGVELPGELPDISGSLDLLLRSGEDAASP